MLQQSSLGCHSTALLASVPPALSSALLETNHLASLALASQTSLATRKPFS